MVPVRYNLRSLMERRATSIMTVLGLGMVAMIFVILFGFIGGLRSTMLNAGADRNWVLLRKGAPNETASFIAHEGIEIVRVRPEIALDKSGAPLLSPEVFAGVNISRDKHVRQFVLLRGVMPIAIRVHRNMHLVAGRWPIRGQGEWTIGAKVQARQPSMAIGSQFHFGRRNWSIVGAFSDDDSARESEIWCDYEDLRSDVQYKGGEDTNSLHVVLKPGMSEAFVQALQSDGRLKLDAMSERDYYESQTKVIDQLRALGLVVALALGIGAMFGGMNTMYTAVARREREIGVLRVLGFSRADILSSFVIESMLLGLGGGVAGVALAFFVAWATGLNSRLLSVGLTFFSYRLTPNAIAAGIISAAIIGVIGGLAPAWRAARIGVIESLREA
ncbi:MAG TPA: ABC transporter permease [Candidatus Binataceae bacterium]|nr:ABC transporter permease [Candidatus Binataceae bacterium]